MWPVEMSMLVQVGSSPLKKRQKNLLVHKLLKTDFCLNKTSLFLLFPKEMCHSKSFSLGVGFILRKYDLPSNLQREEEWDSSSNQFQLTSYGVCTSTSFLSSAKIENKAFPKRQQFPLLLSLHARLINSSKVSLSERVKSLLYRWGGRAGRGYHLLLSLQPISTIGEWQ